MKTLQQLLLASLALCAVLPSAAVCQDPPDQSVFPARVSGRVLLIDSAGVTVARTTADDVGYFSEGVAVAVQGTNQGLVDTHGAWTLPPAPRRLGSFVRGGMIGVTTDGAHWGFMNRAGTVVIAPRYDEVGVFVGGLARVRMGEKWGYVNQAGRIAIPTQFADALNFTEAGLAAVRTGTGWGFINRSGRFVIAPRFRDAGSFHDGLAPVKVDSLWGYVAGNGHLAIPARFQSASLFQNHVAYVSNGGKATFINRDGTPLGNARERGFIGPSIARGLIAFRDPGNTECGYAHPDGSVVIEPRFVACEPFDGALALVNLVAGGRQVAAYVNTAGNVVWQDGHRVAPVH